MSRKSDLARLESIIMYIDDIHEIIKRHSQSISKTLEDKEGQYAIMMCLVQIGELVSKIEDPDISSKLPVKLASGLRNIIVHDYEGVDPVIVVSTVNESLPGLRKQIADLLEQ